MEVLISLKTFPERIRIDILRKIRALQNFYFLFDEVLITLAIPNSNQIERYPQAQRNAQ